jgi:hypothetical protein
MLPKVYYLRKKMNFYSNKLFLEWKKELSKRLNCFDFKGYISFTDLDFNPVQTSLVSRLPNEYVANALMKLQDSLQELDFDYKFSFDNVENQWLLKYEIELPEDSDEYSEDEEYSEDLELPVCRCDKCVITIEINEKEENDEDKEDLFNENDYLSI